MVRKKPVEGEDTRPGFLQYMGRIGEELEANTVRFEWYVTETRPYDYLDGDGHGHIWTVKDSKDYPVSKNFDTEEQAQEWMDAHEPDEGCSLSIKRLRLVRETTERWVSY